MADDIDLWVQATFGVDPASFPPAAADGGGLALADAEDRSQAGRPAAAAKQDSGLVSGLLPISPSDIPDPRKHCIANGKLHNKTSKTLILVSKKASSGDLTEDPPDEITAKSEDDEFRAESAFPDLFKGTIGTIEYRIDDAGTKWVLTWSMPQALNIGENNIGTAKVIGPNAKDFAAKAKFGAGKEADFTYTLEEKGGADPVKPDGPEAGVTASCLITVTNKTALPLSLAHEGHERGDFMTIPPTDVAPGASVSFASIEEKQAKERGCKGFVTWDVGSPSIGTWRVEWDNPLKEKNTVAGTVDPASAGFKSVEQIGQGDENVPVAFTLSGGPSGPGPGPKPPPGPQPPGPEEPDPPFEPPAKPGQPTLRKGDKSPDGWVEYAQQTLNFHLKGNLAIDGDFGNATLAAVRKFQALKKLTFDDGIIGNETWAALREGAPEKPATDGRQPHSFEEKGKQGRFTTEKPHNCHYFTAKDELQMRVVSVGEQGIEGGKVTIKVTQPDGTQKVQLGAVGKEDGPTPDGQGALHSVTIETFSARFKIKDKAAIGACVIDAYLDTTIGGDVFHGNPQVDP